jgi:hypothetical protein
MRKFLNVMANTDEVDFLISYESRESEGFDFRITFEELCKEMKVMTGSVEDAYVIFTMQKLGWDIEKIPHENIYSGWVDYN